MEPPERLLKTSDEWRTLQTKADSNPYSPASAHETAPTSMTIDAAPQLQSLESVPPYTTVGQISYAPATQTTVVTTTTTTTTALPPLVLKAPRQLSELDPKLYPLASSPTPSSIKRFCFNLGGRPTYFREAENVEATLEEIKQQHESLEVSNGIVRSLSQHDLHYEASDPFAPSLPTAHLQVPEGLSKSSLRKNSASPVSIFEAANIAKVQQEGIKPHNASASFTFTDVASDQVDKEDSHNRSHILQAVSPATPHTDHRSSNRVPRLERQRRNRGIQRFESESDSQSRNPADLSCHTPNQPLGSFSSEPGFSIGPTSANSYSGRVTSCPQRAAPNPSEESDPPIASCSGYAVATPPVTETDLQNAFPVQGERSRSMRPPPLDLLGSTTSQDLSLPSPSLSPITAANNRGVKHGYFDKAEEEQDGVDPSFDLSSLPRQPSNPGHPRSPPARALFSQRGDTQGLEMPSLRSKESAQTSAPTMMDIPTMLDSFDALPTEMKTYVMYQMLRRCPKPVLHFVAGVVNPALKCDFVALLPIELSLNIIKYLDVKSMCRAAQVSKRWRQTIDSDEQAWKELFDKDGYSLDEGELSKAVREGWGWQHPHGLHDWETDISDSSVPNWKYDSEWSNGFRASSAAVTIGSGGASGSAAPPRQTGRAKRKSTAKTSSRKQQKRRETSKEVLDTGKFDTWMQQLSSNQGPYAAASAAALAVPNPNVGLSSLKNLHLYKSIYRRHHLIRKSWTEDGIKPRHIAFRAHHNHVVTCLQFDTDKILTGSDDTNINVYDTKTGALRTRLEGHEGGVWALQYEGNVLVSGSTDRSVRVWDIEKGVCTQVFQGHTSTVRCLQILMPTVIGHSASGRAIVMPKQPLIITGSRDSNLRVWKLPRSSDQSFYQAGPPANDTDGLYFVRLLTGHHHSVRAIAAYGDTLVSGSYDCTVRVWRISTGETVHRLTGHTQKVYSVVLDHKRNRCISGSMDNLVKVWSLETGSVLFNLEGHSSLVGLLDLSDDRLVSAAADSTLRIWDPENGQCKSTLSAHTGAITCFQHDGHKVVSGSDRTLKMWNVRTGECVKDLLTDLSGVWQVKFNARRCVAAVQRGTFTYIEVLDFGASRDGVEEAKLGRRFFVGTKGNEARDPGDTSNDTEAANPG
ncbi:MAG: SCF ubiquitin ligase complex subunit cdc4 [Candelina mexicana]|nr:MAG: SCF ubiquitin ligase complex subunit cdc4 [Candelina mexicana]